MGTIQNAVAGGYQSFMRASDQLNADKLANRLVEVGYNAGGARIGGLVAAGIGVSASAGGTALLLEHMNPLDTLRELPAQVAAQSGFAHQAIEVFGAVLQAGAEAFVLANTVNFGVQSVDAAVDMLRATKHRTLKLRDYAERPARIALDDTRRA